MERGLYWGPAGSASESAEYRRLSMAKPDIAPTTLAPRERVTLTRDIRGVAEGSSGLIKVANGLTWARYWVQFDSGAWVGSVSGADLVRESDWEAFKVRRTEEANRPAVAATPLAASGDSAAPSGSAADSRVPAHLLERSQKARARKSAPAE